MEDRQAGKDAMPEAPAALSVGATLRAAREAQGLTVEEIAERVKFSVRQVEALEQDDVAHLPQGTFLRGFVRSYARVLGIDEAQLLSATHTETEHHFDVTDVQAGGAPLPYSGDNNRRSHYLMYGALLLAFVLAVFIWSNRGALEAPPAKPAEVMPPAAEVAPDMGAASAVAETAPAEPVEATAEAEKTVAPVPEKVMEKVVQKSPEPVVAKPVERPVEKPALTAVKPAAPVPVAKPAPVAAPTEPVKPVSPPPAPTKPVVPVVVQPAAKPAEAAKPAPAVAAEVTDDAADDSDTPAKPAMPLAQLMKRPIHIVFLEEAWMEVKDVNGEILLSRVTKAGEEKWIGGNHRAPYDITIGRPSAIRMYYHGKEVDLSGLAPGSVGKMTLE
ncbi:MAG: RodZ domain-containing protein [Pseudomonadota bacterium]